MTQSTSCTIIDHRKLPLKRSRGKKRSLLFWNVTQRRLILTDVSGQHIGPMFLNFLCFEDRIARLPRNAGEHLSRIRNIVEGKKSDKIFRKLHNWEGAWMAQSV